MTSRFRRLRESALVRRIVAAMGANAFGQVVNTLIQLASLPVFLRFWSVDQYGRWLILSAMPSYITMADAGILATTSNEMTIAMARGDEARAKRLFQSALAFLILATCTIGLGSVVVITALPIGSLRGAGERAAVVALVFCVLVSFFGGLSDAVFRSTGRYARGTMLTNTSRLAEWGGSLVGLVATRSVVGVALGSLAGRALAIGWMARLAMREGGPYRFGFADAHWAEIRALLKPALSFMVFPLANALTFQGITLTVGHFYGARVVAIFNAHRTLSRLLVQAISVLGLSVWTEFARLFGQDDRAGLRRLFRNASGLAILGSAVMGAALFVTAPFIIRWWSRGAISFNSSLLALLLVSAVLNGFWFVPRVLLMSINAHVKLSQWTLATSALTLGLAFAFGRHFGVLSSASAMIVGDAAICLVGTVFAVRLTDAKLGRSPREDTPLTPTADRAA